MTPSAWSAAVRCWRVSITTSTPRFSAKVLRRLSYDRGILGSFLLGAVGLVPNVLLPRFGLAAAWTLPQLALDYSAVFGPRRWCWCSSSSPSDAPPAHRRRGAHDGQAQPMALAFEVELASPQGVCSTGTATITSRTAFCRLLGLSREQLEAWLAAADSVVTRERCSRGWRQASRSSSPFRDPLAQARLLRQAREDSRVIWHASIAESPAFGIARSDYGELGWLATEEARAG